MRVGVVSDTHLPRFGRALPAALVEGLDQRGVELVLHLGDFTDLIAARLFEERWPFDAVAGNNDGPEIVERFGRRKLLELDGARVGLVHGDGTRGTTLRRAHEAFQGERLDLLLFGHSHIPYLQRDGERWVLNPGSPTDKRRQPRYSFATVEIRDGIVLPELHFYNERRAV